MSSNVLKLKPLLSQHHNRRWYAGRPKTSSAQYVASRVRDPVFEKLMDHYKHLAKILPVQDLILANTHLSPPHVSLNFLSKLSQKLRLNPTATAYLRRFPNVFNIQYHPATSQTICQLTDTALALSRQEADAINSTLDHSVNRLVRILSMSLTKSVPLRAVFKVWKELGLPDDFEDSVIARNPSLFKLREGNERNTHVLMLNDGSAGEGLSSAVEEWRIREGTAGRFEFKQGFPPGMRLSKGFKRWVEGWQRVEYAGPYDELMRAERRQLEKRAVAIAHEFLSLTVEKTVEVEKMSQFRKWFGIGLNIRDMFLDHPGIFYLSTKGKRHTIFLREGYERDRVRERTPVYDVRRKLLYLVMMGPRGARDGSSPPQLDIF